MLIQMPRVVQTEKRGHNGPTRYAPVTVLGRREIPRGRIYPPKIRDNPMSKMLPSHHMSYSRGRSIMSGGGEI